jgi:hypothetical protein
MTDQIVRPRRASHGDTRITVETRIDPWHAEMFWELYLTAFGPLRSRAVARQVLHHDEFIAEMADPRIWKYVAWDLDGEPIGLTTLTRELASVPWVSPEYFEVNFPEAAARNAVYYLGFTLAHPGQRQSRLFVQMLAAVVERLVKARAVCAYDVCAYNNATFRFGDHIEMMLHRLADVTVEKIDTQTYYNATFG